MQQHDQKVFQGRLHSDKSETERNDWLVGADIIKAPPGKALRYFDDPTKDGYSIGSAKDYYDGMEVHASSGVFNKAFYLLAHQPGWNVQSAFTTVAVANRVYWDPDTGFDEAACDIAKAAQDLGHPVADVVAAFSAVDVDATCGTTPPSGDTELDNGVPLNNLQGIMDSENFYYIDVPANQSRLRISTYYGSGDVDLYVRYKDKPTTTQFDCRPYLDGNYETCTWRYPTAGRYYIMLKGFQAYKGVTLYARYY